MAYATNRILFLAGLTLLLAGCREEDKVHLPPQINCSPSPDNGLTTTVFKFDFSKSFLDRPDQNELFFKWDWDNDGVWDTPFSDKIQFEHRYYIAGGKTTRVIMMDLNGLSDTTEFEIQVDQGYSKPQPKLAITPYTGNPFTWFTLDATGTKDDEDSIETLKFRWDFNGDGTFDTSFGDSAICKHQFTELGTIRPVVEVQDTMGLTAQVAGKMEATIWDSTIVADFNWTPAFPVTEDPIFFDGSLSHDSEFPDLPMQYKWDWNNDRIFETQFSDNPVADHSFKLITKQKVRLQVMNYRGLINEVVKEVSVNHKNQPPVAVLDASSQGGNTDTKIRFDLWDSRDLENSPTQLLSRWDWNGDGVWDNDYGNNVELFHVFSEPGIYPVTVEVTDEGGLTDTIMKNIYIGTGTNEMDIFIDKRFDDYGYEYYGIAKIGGLWWFSKNMQYRRDSSFSIDYGCLYPSEKVGTICPDGWRIPSKSEWNQLLSQYSYEDLLPGGKSGFNAILAGMMNSRVKPKVLTGKGKYGHYWTATKPSGDGSLSTWIISFDNIKRQMQSGYQFTSWSYSVRCVKDAK
ncbi:MAG: PKD domain-containing protein [Bacteroidales bacterium]|nr:PKD domain-containing protein [Bacteroidales bacterium]